MGMPYPFITPSPSWFLPGRQVDWVVISATSTAGGAIAQGVLLARVPADTRRIVGYMLMTANNGSIRFLSGGKPLPMPGPLSSDGYFYGVQNTIIPWTSDLEQGAQLQYQGGTGWGNAQTCTFAVLFERDAANLAVNG